MATKLASQVKPGDVLLGCRQNPNVRGTVSLVCRFDNSIARFNETHKAQGWKGYTKSESTPASKIRTPPSAQTARASAAAEEDCYTDYPGTVVLQLGAIRFSLNSNTEVEVFVPLLLHTF